MKSGQRFAEGDPTVPMVTVSAARAGAAASSEAIAKPSIAGATALNMRIISLRMRSMRSQSEKPASWHLFAGRLLGLCLPRACPFGRGAILQLSTIVPSNFCARRLPDLVVLADMLERGVECADAVGQAGQVRMQRDMHDAAGSGALTIKGLELPANRVLEIGRLHVSALESLLVVDVVAVRE